MGKIKYGKVNQLPGRIEDKDVTVQIALKIEGDLLRALKEHAANAGLPYQTHMKQLLRKALQDAEQPNAITLVHRRLDDIERKITVYERKRKA